MKTRDDVARTMVAELLDRAAAQATHPDLDEIQFDRSLLTQLTDRVWRSDFRMPIANAVRREFQEALHAQDDRCRVALALGQRLSKLRYPTSMRESADGHTVIQVGLPLFTRGFFVDPVGVDPLFDPDVDACAN